MRVIFLILTAASLLFGAYTRNDTLETVYDSETGLTWMDDANVSSQVLDWNASIDYCENLDFAGRDDWRLPNINELLSITDLSVDNPAIDSTFQNTAFGYYCSSTTYAPDTPKVWTVRFRDGGSAAGGSDSKINSHYVRCARDGQIIPSTPVPLSDGAKAALALLFGLGVFVVLRRRRVV